MAFYRIVLLFVVLSCVAVSSLFAAEPQTNPLLRIETGMHSVKASSIAVDRNGLWLATASLDKTVRIWSLTDGRLLRVIRPPIGSENEGKLYAVDMSADGSLLAASGFTHFNKGKTGKSEEGHNVYFFSRSSGRLLARISGFGNVIDTLAFSPDGRNIAVGSDEGLRVYRLEHQQSGTLSPSLVYEDTGFKGRIYSLKFSRQGTRMAATSSTGFIRLFDVSPAGVVTVRTTHAAVDAKSAPVSLDFSPDGTRIAVGYDLIPARVEILDAADLSLLSTPDVQDFPKSRMNQVGWSSDGEKLYASGYVRVKEKHSIVSWSQQGRGAPRLLPTNAQDAIQYFATLSGGRLVAVSMDPAITIFDGSERIVAEKHPEKLTLSSARGSLRVSRDGLTVAFTATESGAKQQRIIFSVQDRSLMTGLGESALEAYPRPITERAGMEIKKGDGEVLINGKPFKLSKGENYNSHVISPDAESAVVATNWNVRCFGKDGKQRWRHSTSQFTRAITISEDGRLAVLANASGSLTWYQLKDGKYILSFFLHRDRQRWALWTPYGFYDASPGGEDLIGWHINNGKDREADFFPASRFRGLKHKPDLISSYLETLNVDKLAQTAKTPVATGQAALQGSLEKSADGDQNETPLDIAANLPPVLTIMSPSDGMQFTSGSVTLSYSARTQSGSPVTGVKVLLDGRPLETGARGLKAVEKVKKEHDRTSITIPVPGRNVEISLIAENRHGTSVPATIHLAWAGTAKNEEFVAKPKLYALAIGVSEYARRDLSLKYAAKDARDFSQALLRQKGGLYREVSVKVLTDKAATRDDIMDGLDWLQKETTSRDVAMVFIAGHGVNDPNGIYYYLPHNADPDKLKRTGVVFTDIKNTLSALSGKAILFVDTCHSGNVMGGRRALTDINSMVNELSSAENGVVVFASSTGRQYSLEDEKWGNGAFTKALVEGLAGGADLHGKGKITVNMLDLYLSEKVKELTGGKQTPTTTKPQTIPDFPVAVKR